MVQQRHEIYRPTHKALRHLMYSTTHELGIADFRDDVEARDVITSLERTINRLVIHAEHENDYIHPDLEKRAPGLIAPYETDHQNDEKVYAELKRLAQEADRASGDQKVALGIELYNRFNSFVGDYLGHLVREETELQGALWDNFTDEELGAMGRRLIANIPPDQMPEFLTGVCAALNADELTGMLGRMKAMAPPETFEGVMKMAEQACTPSNFEKVRARLA